MIIISVRLAIRDILANPIDNNSKALAFYVWSSQFDHPYDGAYYQAWSELTPDEKKRLLILGGEQVDHESFFVSPLISELASFGDPSVFPVLRRWTTLPVNQNSMPQQAFANYIMAHIALARLGCALQFHANNESDAAQATRAVGEIYYWLNRIDLQIEQRKRECKGQIEILMRHKCCVAVGVLSEVCTASCCFVERVKSLPGADCVSSSIGTQFPDEVAEICRQALQHPELQKGYFDPCISEQVIEFALISIGEWGNSIDRQLLQQWSPHPIFGTHAVNAIKQLEQRNLKRDRI